MAGVCQALFWALGHQKRASQRLCPQNAFILGGICMDHTKGECVGKELAREEPPGKEAPSWEGEVRRAPKETQDQRLENSRGADLGEGFQVEVVAKPWRWDCTWHGQGRGPEWLAGSVGGGKCLGAGFCLAHESLNTVNWNFKLTWLNFVCVFFFFLNRNIYDFTRSHWKPIS